MNYTEIAMKINCPRITMALGDLDVRGLRPEYKFRTRKPRANVVDTVVRPG